MIKYLMRKSYYDNTNNRILITDSLKIRLFKKFNSRIRNKSKKRLIVLNIIKILI